MIYGTRPPIPFIRFKSETTFDFCIEVINNNIKKLYRERKRYAKKQILQVGDNYIHIKYLPFGTIFLGNCYRPRRLFNSSTVFNSIQNIIFKVPYYDMYKSIKFR